MRSIRNPLAIILVALLAACSTTTKNAQLGAINGEKLEILDALPREIEGFIYRGAKSYPDPWGYSLRYQLERNQLTYSDVFIYPVPGEAEGYGQKEVVISMSNQALKEIDIAKEQGLYSKYSVINRRTFEINGNFTIRIDIFLVKSNLESYSLLFLTESNGKLIKVRMTMADNESNRNNTAWQKFAVKVITTIFNNIEKA